MQWQKQHLKSVQNCLELLFKIWGPKLDFRDSGSLGLEKGLGISILYLVGGPRISLEKQYFKQTNK